MTKKTKYIGITIGPIYKTLALADKTREIWGGSYLFSWLCRELLIKITESKSGIDMDQIILPSPIAIKGIKPGVGLYPDRIIIKSKGNDYQKVIKIILDVKKNLVEKILSAINNYKAFDPYARLFKTEVNHFKRSREAKEYLFRYFQVYSIEVSENDLKLKNDKNNLLGVVKCINFYLDHLELRSSIAGFDPDPIKVFLRGINHSFLLKNAFKFDKFDHFPSLPEISTTEVRFIKDDTGAYKFQEVYDKSCDDSLAKALQEERKATTREASTDEAPVNEGMSLLDKAEDDLSEKLFSIEGLEDDLRTYHKYIAVVHADGDRMGRLIGSLDNDAEVQSFSKDLIKFSQEANKILAGTRFTNGDLTNWGYGASPVYIGGDDLVFFAPIASRVEINGQQEFQTVFHLLRDIDNKFNEIFNKKEAEAYIKYPQIYESERPCLSYGISITYIKSPLREAFEQSRELMYQVKNDVYKSRNRINFVVQKHSGQLFGGIIDKNVVGFFDAVLTLLDANHTNTLKLKKSEIFINSISKNLTFYKSSILAISDLATPNQRKESIEALFDDLFNEPIHKEFEDYLNEIRDILIHMIERYPDDINKSNPDYIKLRRNRLSEVVTSLHGILRFIHFIRDNESRN